MDIRKLPNNPNNFRGNPQYRGNIPRGIPIKKPIQSSPIVRPFTQPISSKPNEEHYVRDTGGGKQENFNFQQFKGYNPITRFANEPPAKKSPSLALMSIGILVIAVAIILVIILFSRDRVAQTNIGGENLDMQIKNVQLEGESAKINMRIDPKNQEIIGIKFFFETDDGIEEFEEYVSISEITEKEFIIQLTNINISEIKKIRVSPIFEDKKEIEFIGEVQDSYTTKESDFQNYNQEEDYAYGENFDNYYSNSNKVSNQTTNATQNSSTNQTNTSSAVNNLTANITTCINGSIIYQALNSSISIINCTKQCIGGEWINKTCSIECISGYILNNSICILNTSTSTTNNALSTPVCGNGIIETGESCDFENLSGKTCQSFGYAAGTLGCKKTCIFDTTYCMDENDEDDEDDSSTLDTDL